MLYAAGKRRQKARIQKTERNKKQNKKDKGKTVTKDIGKENKKPLTKYHDTFNEHYKNYSPEELENKLRRVKNEHIESKPNNYNNNSSNIERKLYLTAIENGLNSLSEFSQERVINYALNNNLDNISVADCYTLVLEDCLCPFWEHGFPINW